MPYPYQYVEELLRHVNLVEVVGRDVRLRRAGKGRWEGLCPFHNEKNPSFNVFLWSERVSCHSCGHHGDVIKFLMYFHGVEYTKAVALLARRTKFYYREWKRKQKK